MGLLGGTFDPPHLGHLAAARAVLRELRLHRVDLVPANDPWQKTDSGTDVTSGEIRLEMVRALVNDEPGLGVDAREIRRGGRTYTVDTLRELRRDLPTAELFLIVGADTAGRIGTWREPRDVLSLSTLVVVNRGADSPVLPTDVPVVRVVRMEPVDVSSTAVRAAVAQGRDVTGLVGPRVASVIASRRLYGASR